MLNRWPDTFVEIHQDLAQKHGIESGDEVRLWSDDILIQTGGWVKVKGDDYTYTRLEEQGLIRIGRGEVRAVAIVNEDVLPNVSIRAARPIPWCIAFRTPSPTAIASSWARPRLRKLANPPTKIRSRK